MALEYIKRQQKHLEEDRQLEAEKEAVRIAKIEAEVCLQEEIIARKKLLLEQQEDERLRQKYIQKKEKLAEQKWNNQFDILLAQLKDHAQKDDKLEEIRIIIQNHEPSLQELDWESWLLSDPLNQELAELDLERAMEMFKRDNLLAKRRKGTRGKIKTAGKRNVLSFTGNTVANAAEDYVTTTFDPDDYALYDGFTVSYWVRPDALGATMFALGRKPHNNERFQFGINTSTDFFIGVGKLRSRSTEHGMEVDTWYHWAVTYAGQDNGRAIKVYRDGTLLQETTAIWTLTSNTGGEPVYFGGYSIDDGSGGDRYTAGWACGLSQIAIFDEVKDLSTLYNNGTPADLQGQSGLVGYWRLNEGGGITVKDYSGNGNHGTFAAISGDTTAYPTWEKAKF